MMKTPVLVAIILVVSFVAPCRTVLGASQTEYAIQIANDGSATWTVTQTLEVNSSIETLETLQNRITLLVEASESTTGRAMVASADSLTFTSSGSYVEAEYKFQWENFSKIEDAHIVVGDVFQVPNFFNRLYGDGEVYMTYPSQYVVDPPILPSPSTRNDSIQTLEWLGTKDFQNGTRIVLSEESATPGFIDALRENAVLILGLAAIAAGSSIGFYTFRHGWKRKMRPPETAEPRNPLGMKSDEEKTVELIRSSGGSVYQSAITNQFSFSKAKTSQLLGILEHKGVIRRYKKGRDKIVVLIKQDKSGIE
jgi:uncharacterized membrane protein